MPPFQVSTKVHMEMHSLYSDSLRSLLRAWHRSLQIRGASCSKQAELATPKGLLHLFVTNTAYATFGSDLHKQYRFSSQNLILGNRLCENCPKLAQGVFVQSVIFI